jgi:hypothetical protein
MKLEIDNINDLFSRFRRDYIVAEYDLPFESFVSIEKKLGEALQELLIVTALELKSIRESIDLHLAVLLNHYSRRMASAAVRENRNDLVAQALLAISLDDSLLDDRDVYRTGALIIDCCQRLNLDPTKCFEHNSILATDRRKSLLNRQLSSAPEYMRSLRSMKFGIVDDEAGFKYVDHLIS